MTHPDGGSGTGPSGDSGTGPRFRIPSEATPLNSAIDCVRAWGRALAEIARLFSGRPE